MWRQCVRAGFGRTLLDAQARNEIALYMRDADAVDVIGAMLEVNGYEDKTDRRLWRTLRAQGTVRGAGRKPRPGLERFVREMTAVAAWQGLPISSAEHGRLTRFLRCVAHHAGIAGDPRSVLRRLLKSERKLKVATAHAILLAAAEAGEAFSRGERGQPRRIYAPYEIAIRFLQCATTA